MTECHTDQQKAVYKYFYNNLMKMYESYYTIQTD